jgi:hypothetical protein
MGLDRSPDADRLLQDIELELASIRAAMALRRLDVPSAPTQPPVDAPTVAVPAARVIGSVDVKRASPLHPVAQHSAPPSEMPAASQARRQTLQERLASLAEDA